MMDHRHVHSLTEKIVSPEPAGRLTSRQDAWCGYCGTAVANRLWVLRGKTCFCEQCLLELPPLAAQTAEESAMYADFVEALVQALDLREHETGLHSQRVACHTQLLARCLSIDATWLNQVYWGALLHDIGKIAVADHILQKQDSLSEEEWNVMHRHPQDGRQLVSALAGLTDAAEIVFAHEERFDGSGYPRGLRGEEIPLGARIFAIFDALDAITSDRPCHKARPFAAAKEEILSMTGIRFDPLVVDVFLSEEARLREMVALKFG